MYAVLVFMPKRVSAARLWKALRTTVLGGTQGACCLWEPDTHTPPPARDHRPPLFPKSPGLRIASQFHPVSSLVLLNTKALQILVWVSPPHSTRHCALGPGLPGSSAVVARRRKFAIKYLVCQKGSSFRLSRWPWSQRPSQHSVSFPAILLWPSPFVKWFFFPSYIKYVCCSGTICDEAF